jgi:3-dehydroquinate dehydratase-2
MPRTILILNGSNLNMLGKREPKIYGTTTLAEVERRSMAVAHELGLACEFRQTNSEATLIDWLHEAFERDAAVIINPAGFSFGSIPVLDAVKILREPVIELHITNIHQRDEIYRHSLISTVASAVICGLGINGYEIALRAMALTLREIG